MIFVGIQLGENQFVADMQEIATVGNRCQDGDPADRLRRHIFSLGLLIWGGALA
jgi:hypothetical protein